MKIWYVVAAQADGAALVHFFQNEQDAQAVYKNESTLDTYACNENGPQSFDVQPDGTTTIQFTPDLKIDA